jgi:hypothetical protein
MSGRLKKKKKAIKKEVSKQQTIWCSMKLWPWKVMEIHSVFEVSRGF